MISSLQNAEALYSSTKNSTMEALQRKDAEQHKAGSFKAALKDKMELDGSPHHKAPKDKKLWDACQEMESLFVGRMLKEMRKTVHKGEFLHGGQPEEIFEDMLYDEYALSVSRNADVGIASMLYNQLSNR